MGGHCGEDVEEKTTVTEEVNTTIGEADLVSLSEREVVVKSKRSRN